MSLRDWFQRVFGKKESLAPPPVPPTPPVAPTPPTPVVVTTPTPPVVFTPPPAPVLGPPPPPSDYNATDFLPIAQEELREQAKNVTRGGAWFGRRDLIPPAEDLRTKLIDRAMVTHGLLTPEQLAEIHRVGAEMDRVRPQLEAINQRSAQAGEAAVQADREAKAKLKEQKKAESAARKKARADGIAHRKATDIVFVGRGVSGRLGERQSDRERLESFNLPLLSTPAELAVALGLSVSKLRWLTFHTEAATRVHYVSFTVPKKSGGTRTLSAPHRTLSSAQQWILTNILAKIPVESSAHGFLPGRSILTNARPHAGQAVVVNLDLENFFPSIGFFRVRHLFGRIGYSPAVATLLALLCTECPRRTVEYAGQVLHVAIGPRGLPQGACTSPALSNQVARRLDKRLGGVAKKLGITYTRYADDLTFSGGDELNTRVGYLMARVRHLAADEGFAVNVKKTRVQRRNAAQKVTGLVVNDRPGVSRQVVRRLRAILHRAKSEGLDAQNRTGRPDFRGWLEGMIAYVGMVRPETGAKLRAELESIPGRIELRIIRRAWIRNKRIPWHADCTIHECVMKSP